MKKYTKKAESLLLSALLVAVSLTGMCMPVSAEEETELETETEAAEPTELSFDLDGEIVTVRNAAGSDLDDASLTFAAREEEEREDGEPSGAGEIILTEVNGVEHIFAVDDATELKSLADWELTEKIGFLFLSGTDEEGGENYYYEDAEEVTLDTPVTMYTLGMVNVRQEADGSSELVGTAARGSEVEVSGGTSSWFLITQGDLSGYVAARYLTMDASSAEAAVEAEAAARAAIEAAAAANAAAAAAEAAASYSGGSSDSAEVASDDACLTGGVLY